MFSEALTLYLYRYRLTQGPREKLTNLIVLEEAHNLLLAKQAGSKESVLESSIRMIRQYGLGYIFVDQSASLLSKVAFANSYATIALSQKLRADVQTIAGAMNLSDEQKEALSTLPVGTAIVRLADEHSEPFLIRVPKSPVREGSVSDDRIRAQRTGDFTSSGPNTPPQPRPQPVSPVPVPDKKQNEDNPHPPSPGESPQASVSSKTCCDSLIQPSPEVAKLTREELRFLTDLVGRPLSTTVHRYERLHLSRRRGNAVRQHLQALGLIEPGPVSRASLEHRYWVQRPREHFEKQGYGVTCEYAIAGNGAVDLLAEKPGERVAIEVETGKSDIRANLTKVHTAGFNRMALVATCPTAVVICQKIIVETQVPAELLTWLDVS